MSQQKLESDSKVFFGWNSDWVLYTEEGKKTNSLAKQWRKHQLLPLILDDAERHHSWSYQLPLMLINPMTNLKSYLN